MSDTDGAARPRQLTMAAGFVIGGSVLLVLAVFDALANLESVDTRDAVTGAVDSATGLGMSVDSVLVAMRIGLNVAAVCAAAAVVLGVFVLQRHRAARAVLGFLAVPILVTAPLTGSFLGAVVAASIAMLWSGQARDWFAGRPVREAPSRAERTEERGSDPHLPGRAPEPPPAQAPVPEQSTSALSTGETSTAPQPTSGYGEAPVRADQPPAPQPWAEQPRATYPQQPQFQDPRWTTGTAYAGAPADPRRGGPPPAGVKIACVATWVFSVAVLLVLVAVMIVISRDTSAVLAEVERNPAMARTRLTPDGLLAAMWVVAVMFIGWAAAASVLAWFVWRRHDWARYLLVLSAGAVFVAAVFAFPVGIPLQAACVATIVLLLNRPARDWFAGPGAQRTGGPDRPVW